MENMQTWLYFDIHVPIKAMKLSSVYLSVYEKSRLNYMNEIYLNFEIIQLHAKITHRETKKCEPNGMSLDFDIRLYSFDAIKDLLMA